jgi:alpha-tubulin suppressor-like RCC1 family protein
VIILFVITILVPIKERVKAISIIVDVQSGAKHTVALKEDGSIWVWGSNENGQLGNGTYGPNVLEPFHLSSLSNFIAISTGVFNTVALKNDGTVWTWGSNGNGQIGNGAVGGNIVNPYQIPTLSNIKAIESGDYHMVALKGDGTVWTWGLNNYGQIGKGTAGGNVATPQKIASLTNIKSISAGSYHSAALGIDGSVWTWGENYFGQIGNGTTNDNIPNPYKVIGISDVKSISTGNEHTIALKNDGTFWAWGYNNAGQKGNGTSGVNVLSPFQITSLTGVESISAGGNNSSALKIDGTAWIWGDNSSGQIGNGGTANALIPTQIIVPSEIKKLSIGGSHTAILKEDGSVWTVGKNTNGQLGDKTIVNKLNSIQITNFYLFILNKLAISNFTSILNFESYSIGLQDASLNLQTPLEISIENISESLVGWRINFKLEKIINGTEELLNPSIHTSCANSQRFLADGSGNKIDTPYAIDGFFNCSENMMLFGTSYPLITAQPDATTAGKHFFKFPLDSILLNFDKETKAGVFSGITTFEIITSP